MKITPQTVAGRKVWNLDNGAVTLSVMEGGGHLCSLTINGPSAVNPLWQPNWKTIEPWHFRKRHADHYQNPLLAAISGHNLCFAHFGEPSPEEEKAGLSTHGEAPVRRWKVDKRNVSRRALTFSYGCNLPIAQMSITRRIVMPLDSHVIQIRETIRNLARRDVPFGICEHVTFGPPFLEPGKTLFDASVTRGHTLPADFGSPQRLKTDTPFVWPEGPGKTGKSVDLRTMRKKKNSDFSAQMMDPACENAWFSAVHPGLQLLTAYVWKSCDFPWLGNWEENHARQTPPWKGKTLARGMEFSTSPFPLGLRAAVALNTFQGRPTYRWLPARGLVNIEYAVMIMRVQPGCKGVTAITPREKGGYQVDLVH